MTIEFKNSSLWRRADFCTVYQNLRALKGVSNFMCEMFVCLYLISSKCRYSTISLKHFIALNFQLSFCFIRNLIVHVFFLIKLDYLFAAHKIVHILVFCREFRLYSRRWSILFWNYFHIYKGDRWASRYWDSVCHHFLENFHFFFVRIS